MSCGLYGAEIEYTIAPLLSASSSEADTRRIFVPMLASCFTFSIYFYKDEQIHNILKSLYSIKICIMRNLLVDRTMEAIHEKSKQNNKRILFR